MTSSESSHGEDKAVSAALIRGNQREREREEADVRSSRERGLLIGNPRTPRGPRCPGLVRISLEKKTPIGSLLPDFESSIFFFFFFSFWWAEIGLGLGLGFGLSHFFCPLPSYRLYKIH